MSMMSRGLRDTAKCRSTRNENIFFSRIYKTESEIGRFKNIRPMRTKTMMLLVIRCRTAPWVEGTGHDRAPAHEPITSIPKPMPGEKIRQNPTPKYLCAQVGENIYIVLNSNPGNATSGGFFPTLCASLIYGNQEEGHNPGQNC